MLAPDLYLAYQLLLSSLNEQPSHWVCHPIMIVVVNFVTLIILNHDLLHAVAMYTTN